VFICSQRQLSSTCPSFAVMDQSSYRTRRNNESRVEKEQSPYLGRPSSGAPDLEGKQEHSQQ